MSHMSSNMHTGVNYQGYPVDSMGNPIMNQSYPSRPAEMKTGTRKVEIRQNARGVTTKEKTSFYDPVTGKSEKARNVYYNQKIPSHAMSNGVLLNNSHINNQAMINSVVPLMTGPVMNTPVMSNSSMQTPVMAPMTNTRQRSRSRSSSDERRRQRNYVAPQTVVPASNFNNGVAYNDRVMINNSPPGYIEPMYNNNINMPMNTANNMMVNSSIPMTNQTMANDINHQIGRHEYAQNKGTIKTRGDKIKTKEQIAYTNPQTGEEQIAKIKTEIKTVGDRNRSRSGNKSKTKYNYETDGNEVIIDEKTRQGGVVTNLKNKINNLLHR